MWNDPLWLLSVRANMMNEMRAMKAQVKGGRLILDEPTDLPDGTVVDLYPLSAEVLANGGDYLDDEERRRLHESIERGLEDMRAGRTIDAREAIAELRARALGK